MNGEIMYQEGAGVVSWAHVPCSYCHSSRQHILETSLLCMRRSPHVSIRLNLAARKTCDGGPISFSCGMGIPFSLWQCHLDIRCVWDIRLRCCVPSGGLAMASVVVTSGHHRERVGSSGAGSSTMGAPLGQSAFTLTIWRWWQFSRVVPHWIVCGVSHSLLLCSSSTTLRRHIEH